MKRVMNITLALLLANGIVACKGNNEEEKKPSHEQGKDDAKTDKDGSSEETEEDEIALACKSATIQEVKCYESKDGKSYILGCKDGQANDIVKCYDNSHCLEAEGAFTCACNDGYDLTSNGDGYFCKEQLDFPAAIADSCKDKDDGYSACVNDGSDVWAIYCFEKKIYSGNSGNCTELGQKCGQVTYANGTYSECGECFADSDCPADTSLEHSAGKCVQNKCEIGCETGYRYLEADEEEGLPAECEKADCIQSSDCPVTVEFAIGICNKGKCDQACPAEGYKYDFSVEPFACIPEA